MGLPVITISSRRIFGNLRQFLRVIQLVALQKPQVLHTNRQVKFLLSNLVAENPGGGILAHTPRSGKTFMIISFMQSFLAKSSQARPLVVLAKGISATWKKEFPTRQVEDTPLCDVS